MLAEHGKMARDYPDVRANTVASFALGDYEWMLAFEADELHRIVDLMRDLRGLGGAPARPRGGPVLHRPPPLGRRDRQLPGLSRTRPASPGRAAPPPRSCSFCPGKRGVSRDRTTESARSRGGEGWGGARGPGVGWGGG